jgi:hypothetical protein
MKIKTVINRNAIWKNTLVCAAIGWMCWSTGNFCRAQSPAANPPAVSPDLQEVVSLSKSHMGDDVITNYIKNTGKAYKLSADDIIYLNSQGVSKGVITALLQTVSSAPSYEGNPANPPVAAPPANANPTPTAAAPPPLDNSGSPDAGPTPAAEAPAVPATPTPEYFQAQLAPYGNWVTLPGYGVCWQPAALNFGWRPYYDGGHWEYTDAGWFWASDYPWGDIAFHYGRWAYTPAGWAWVPGYDYAPAWVFWRHADADGYVGWAPLPVGAVFVGGGWAFNGVHVGVDFDFGLSVNFFTFVGCDHFWEHDYRAWIVPHDRVVLVFRHSEIENHFRRDEHGRFFNEGLGRDRMAALTHHEIHATALHDVREREEHRNAMARRDDIHDFKAGAKPNAKRTAETKPGPKEGAERDHETTPGRNQTTRAPEMERGNQEPAGNRISRYPGEPSNYGREPANAAKYQKGQPSTPNVGKGGEDSRNNKDRNGN